jgi:hypothetical protein
MEPGSSFLGHYDGPMHSERGGLTIGRHIRLVGPAWSACASADRVRGVSAQFSG